MFRDDSEVVNAFWVYCNPGLQIVTFFEESDYLKVTNLEFAAVMFSK